MLRPDLLDAVSLLTSLPDAVVVFSEDGGVRWASRTAIQLLGDGDLRNLSLSTDRVHRSDRAEVVALVEGVLAGEARVARAVWRLRRTDGSWIGLDTYLRDARDEQTIQGFVLSARPSADAVHEESGSFSPAGRFAADGYWEWDLDSDRLFLSPEWLATVGWAVTDRSHTSREWFKSVHGDDRPRLMAAIRTHLQDSSARLRCEHRVLGGDGTWRWVQVCGMATRDPEGRVMTLAGTLSDVSEGKLIDRTTGLPNGLLFRDRLSHTFVAHDGELHRFGVLVLDIDRYPVVRETLGNLAGEEMLRHIARRLERTVGPGDTVARLGEARFAILLAGVRGAPDASRVVEGLHESLAEAIKVGAQDVFSTASVGIALPGPGIESPDELLRAAETAMRRARRNPDERSAYYDGEMHREAKERLELETDLRRAIAEGAFELHYQPIVELSDGGIVGFEGLVRWRHAERGGLVPPGMFISISEETGLIVQIGRWVLREAVRQLKSWIDVHPGASELVVSVNVSAREFDQADLADRVLATLDEVGLAPRQLKLEVTETAIMGNPELAAATLRRLKGHGVKLALDDFGTGYSSLGYLHQMPFDDIKIDRSFVNKIQEGGQTPVIVNAIVSLAASLGMDCVAEGIETDEQWRVLKLLGCRFGQGWHFGRPEPAMKLDDALVHLPS